MYALEQVAAMRRRLLADAEVLTLTDHGAGSQADTSRRRTVAEVARGSGTPERFGAYLTRLADRLAARRILELGTNLGLGTAYLALGAAHDAHVVSIDADPAVLAKARRELASLQHAAHIELLEGTFDARLGEALDRPGQLDIAFVDGHHSEAPTLRYFERLLPHCHAGTVLIFDDIHWSPGMTRAWERIRGHEAVTLTVDLYRWGVAFTDPAVVTEQHYRIVPRTWKPWRMGFFS